MDNPTIKIKRTKEELRTYNIFSSILRRPIRRLLEYIGPVMGVVFIVLFFTSNSVIFILIGLFLGAYPYMLRRTVKRYSDISYDSNNQGDNEITLTFSKYSFTSSIGETIQDIGYNSLYCIYQREKDMIIYLTQFSGIYISKASYSEEVIQRINSLIETAIPDKIITFK
jgi:hypothetical protein